MSENQKRKERMMKEISFMFALALLARAMYTDILSGKIENWVISLGGMGCMAYTYVMQGMSGIWSMGKSAGIALLCLFVLYGIGGLGAGDVKLMVMTGMWMPQYMVMLVVGAFFGGGIFACGRMMIRWIRRQQVYVRGETIPFAVPIACSFAGCVVSGGWI